MKYGIHITTKMYERVVTRHTGELIIDAKGNPTIIFPGHDQCVLREGDTFEIIQTLTVTGDVK